MAGIDEYQGVTGEMRFDGRWDNTAPVVTAQWLQGRWRFEPAPATKQAKATGKP